MSKYGADKFADELIMAARVLLMLLFLLFGWQKITATPKPPLTWRRSEPRCRLSLP